MYEHAVGDKLNLFRLFSTLSLHLLRKEGFHGFIVPMSLMADAQAYPLRKFLLEENEIIQIEAFPQKDDPLNRVFFNAKLSTCVYIVNKANPVKPFIIRIHPGKEILESSLPLELSLENIKVLDPENLSFPSNPNIKVDDIQLAAKLVDVSGGTKLGDYAPSQQGEVNLTSHIEVLSDEQIGPEVLRGAHVNRYELHGKPKQGLPKYLNVVQYLTDKKPTSKAFDHKKFRIGYQRGSAIDNWRRIIATMIEPNNFCSDTINYIVEPKELNIYAVLGLLNSKAFEWRFSFTSTNNHVNSYEINSLPIPRISFTTPEDKRRARVAEGIGLYKKYMLESEQVAQGVSTAGKDDPPSPPFSKGGDIKKRGSKKSPPLEKGDSGGFLKHNDKAAEKNDRSVADPHAGGEEEGVSGEHTGAGKLIHGLRGRAGEQEDARRVSEDPDKYRSTTRFIKSSLGIKSYLELAPRLAKGVERVMASLLEKKPEELIVTPEFICALHRDAFGELFPDWAGRYRDRDVKVSDYTPPPYFEAPVLMKQYCDDLDVRLAAINSEDLLLETLAFAEGRFLSIHPFRDFNGRVARMILFALFYRLDLPPVELLPDEEDKKGREKYLKALSGADKLNWKPLIEVWKERLGERGKK